MAKKKAKAGSKRVKATKKKVTRKKTLARAAKKATGKAGKKAAPKKAARKLAKKTVRKVVKKVAKKRAKKIVAKAATKPPVKAAARPKPATKPKLPRRTKQAMPPTTRIVPTAIVDVEPLMPAARVPTAAPQRPSAPVGGVPAQDRPLEGEIVSAGPPATGPRMPAIGDLAPDFQLPDETGKNHSLAQYHGKRVVLYFYPKDDTPGCTAEACGFRDRLGQFADHNAVVLGVSADPVESHQRFAQKYSLTFPILSDEDHAVAERYGVWVEKTHGGEMSMGIARTTFVIDAGGRIEHVFRNVHAEGHEQEVLGHLAL